jgi:hypothetical protein
MIFVFGLRVQFGANNILWLKVAFRFALRRGLAILLSLLRLGDGMSGGLCFWDIPAAPRGMIGGRPGTSILAIRRQL